MNPRGIFQGDLVVKTAIELFLGDLRKSPWVIEDVFSSLIENPMLNRAYGLKEVARAKEFILNNNIPIYMSNRTDKADIPCITIHVGESSESKEHATLGDAYHEIDTLLPEEIDRNIKYIVSPFTPENYDKATGEITLPGNNDSAQYIAEGMVVVDPETGGGYTVIERTAANIIKIKAGAEITNKIGVIPKYQIYRARRERIISSETYNIGCHAQSPADLIFLYGVVKYGLLRYREGLLENNNLQLTNIKSTDLIRNDTFNVENAYSRWIILSGLVEETWIKSPARIIESISFDDSSENDKLKQGLKALDDTALENADADPSDPWIVGPSEE